MKIDLNCDLGESFGVYVLGQDEDILTQITSANIACGFHAGDPSVMVRTVHKALEQNVAIGAHPGYPDLMGFGRRALQATPQDVYDMVLYQVSALYGMTRALGGTLQHVKPHGALYNTAAKDPNIAEAIAKAVHDIDDGLILFGLFGSALVRAGQSVGLRVAQEAFADRTYQKDGSLTSRQQPHAMIEDKDKAIQQVISMVQREEVLSVDGYKIPMQADTICIHGDHPSALDFVTELKQQLLASDIGVEAVAQWK
nr:5-oxoprolinase subunit PxpA [Caldalkalibacillus salinus]